MGESGAFHRYQRSFGHMGLMSRLAAERVERQRQTAAKLAAANADRLRKHQELLAKNQVARQARQDQLHRFQAERQQKQVQLQQQLQQQAQAVRQQLAQDRQQQIEEGQRIRQNLNAFTASLSIDVDSLLSVATLDRLVMRLQLQSELEAFTRSLQAERIQQQETAAVDQAKRQAFHQSLQMESVLLREGFASEQLVVAQDLRERLTNFVQALQEEVWGGSEVVASPAPTASASSVAQPTPPAPVVQPVQVSTPVVTEPAVTLPEVPLDAVWGQPQADPVAPPAMPEVALESIWGQSAVNDVVSEPMMPMTDAVSEVPLESVWSVPSQVPAPEVATEIPMESVWGGSAMPVAPVPEIALGIPMESVWGGTPTLQRVEISVPEIAEVALESVWAAPPSELMSPVASPTASATIPNSNDKARILEFVNAYVEVLQQANPELTILQVIGNRDLVRDMLAMGAGELEVDPSEILTTLRRMVSAASAV